MEVHDLCIPRWETGVMNVITERFSNIVVYYTRVIYTPSNMHNIFHIILFKATSTYFYSHDFGPGPHWQDG